MARKATPGLLDADPVGEVLSPPGPSASTKKLASQKAKKPAKKKARKPAAKKARPAPMAEDPPVQVNFYLSPAVADELEMAQLRLKRLAGKERGKVSKSALLETAVEALVQAMGSRTDEELQDQLPSIYAKKRSTRP